MAYESGDETGSDIDKDDASMEENESDQEDEETVNDSVKSETVNSDDERYKPTRDVENEEIIGSDSQSSIDLRKNQRFTDFEEIVINEDTISTQESIKISTLSNSNTNIKDTQSDENQNTSKETTPEPSKSIYSNIRNKTI